MISGNPFDKGVILCRHAGKQSAHSADKLASPALADRRLDLGGHVIRLGIPAARPLMRPRFSILNVAHDRDRDAPDARARFLRRFKAAKRHLAEINLPTSKPKKPSAATAAS